MVLTNIYYSDLCCLAIMIEKATIYEDLKLNIYKNNLIRCSQPPNVVGIMQ